MIAVKIKKLKRYETNFSTLLMKEMGKDFDGIFYVEKLEAGMEFYWLCFKIIDNVLIKMEFGFLDSEIEKIYLSEFEEDFDKRYNIETKLRLVNRKYQKGLTMKVLNE